MVSQGENGGRGKKKKKMAANTSQHRGESFGTAGGLLGYHSLIAAVARDAENGRGNSCPSPGIQSAEYMAGELMDVSTGRAI